MIFFYFWYFTKDLVFFLSFPQDFYVFFHFFKVQFSFLNFSKLILVGSCQDIFFPKNDERIYKRKYDHIKAYKNEKLLKKSFGIRTKKFHQISFFKSLNQIKQNN